jgi:hypothetical protein
MSSHLAPTFAMTAGTVGTIAAAESIDAGTYGLAVECHSGYIIASS